VHFAGQAVGHRRRVIGLPPALSRLQAGMLEFLPGKLMSRDNLRSLEAATVCDAPLPYRIEPRPIESAAMQYLSAPPALRYDRLRWKAGR
jgi:NADH dehydrogenase